ARNGGTVVLFLSPGMQESWSALAEAHRRLLLEILPAAPLPDSPRGAFRAIVAAADDPLLAGLTDDKFQLHSITTRAFLALNYSESALPLLNLASLDAFSGSRPPGLLYRKP